MPAKSTPRASPIRLTVTLVHEGRAKWCANCVELPVYTHGKTRDEALGNMRKALDLYFETAENPEGDVLPAPEIVPLDYQPKRKSA